MADRSRGTKGPVSPTAPGVRQALLAGFTGALWFVLGIVGLGLLWLVARAFTSGTAAPATVLLGLVAAVVVVLAGDELIHRLLGRTPVF